MQKVRKSLVRLTVGLLLVQGAHAAQNVLKNGSMEAGPGNGLNPQIAGTWIEFGLNVERSTEANLTAGGVASLKAFSDTTNTSAGAYQGTTSDPGQILVTPGQQVQVSWSNFTRGIDKLGGSGQAGFRLEFRGQFNNLISTQEVLPFNSSSPADTWVAGSIGPIAAPANTAKIQVYCRVTWSGSMSGSVYWDDVSVMVNGVEKVINGDFETQGVGGFSPIGIDDWLGFNDQEKSGEQFLHGAFSVKSGSSEQFSGLYQQVGTVADGDRLVLKAKALHASAAPLTAGTTAGIKLEFKSSTPAQPPVENLAFNDTSPTNTWTLVTLTAQPIEVPAGITLARAVMIYAGGPSSLGYVYFDTAELHVNGGGNALLNPSFETGFGGPNGIDNWSEFSSASAFAQRDSSFKFAGTYSCAAGGDAVAGIYQDVPVTAGQTITLSARMYVDSADPLVNASAGIKIEWRGGNRPGDIDIGDPTYNPVVVTSATPTNTWVPIKIDYTMPAGTEAIAQFTNLMAFASGVGEAFFDNCEFVVMNRFDGADSDGDDDQDLTDYAAFQRCYSGNGGGLGWPCTVFDHDEDGDVDLTDYAYFGPRMTGP
jgi:hypothetical protein